MIYDHRMLGPEQLPPQAVERWSMATPDVIAVEEIGGRTLTFSELHHEGLRWARALSRLGVGAGDHVATMLPASVEAGLALLGLAWLRAVEVPVNTAHRGQLLRYTLDFADATVLVIDAALLERLVEISDEVPALRTVIVVGGPAEADLSLPFRIVPGGEFLDDAVTTAHPPGPRVSDVAALLFTSGTTGPSKAVIAPWGLIHSIWSWVPEDALGPGEGLFCSLPLFHNSGRSGFVNAMDRGARFVFRDKFSVTNFWDDVSASGCVAAALVGPLTALVWAAPPRPDDRDNPLRGVILGPMIPEMEAFEERFGVKVATCYGQTESGCPLTTGWAHGPPANCGRQRESWPFNEVRIVDDHDQPVGVGEVGELVVRSAEPWSMNLGYYKMPEATVEAWRNGWFHTGDAFRVDADGWHYFVDRLSDTIRRRGENISSFEVETAINQHPHVVEAAVVGVDVAHGDQEVLAVLIAVKGEALDPADLVAWLEPRLPHFMLPRFVEIAEDLPRNMTTNRVLKAELRERGVTDATWDAQGAG